MPQAPQSRPWTQSAAHGADEAARRRRRASGEVEGWRGDGRLWARRVEDMGWASSNGRSRNRRRAIGPSMHAWPSSASLARPAVRGWTAVGWPWVGRGSSAWPGGALSACSRCPACAAARASGSGSALEYPSHLPSDGTLSAAPAASQSAAQHCRRHRSGGPRWPLISAQSARAARPAATRSARRRSAGPRRWAAVAPSLT